MGSQIAKCRLLAGAAPWCVAALLLSGRLPTSHAAVDPAALTSTLEVAQQQRIGALIRQLGDDQYAVRQQAQEELGKLGAEAFDQLVGAQDNDDIEIAARARYLVRRIRVEWVQDADSPQVKELLKDYDEKSFDAREACLRQLAAMHEVGLLPLCRLIRFEKSTLLAKKGALYILSEPPPTGAAWSQQARVLLDNLRGSTRAAARWLRTYVKMHDQPDAALADWNKLVAEELSAVETDSPAVETEVQNGLLRFQAELLLKHQQRPQALAVMHTLLERETNDVDSLIDFIDWLVGKEAWEVVDDAAVRFKDAFNANRALLYTLAQAKKIHGDDAAAEQDAQRAFHIASTPDELDTRLEMARRLRYRGMLPWSEREYKFVLDPANNGNQSGSVEVLQASFALAEMFHDQERDAEAAEALRKVVDQLKGNGELRQRIIDLSHSPGSLRARMHFFLSCVSAAKHDRPHQIEELDAALDGDPTDPDSLIAVYHLPGQSAQRRKQVVDLIHDALQQTQNELNDSPDQAGLLNQYAWLVCNTEGDQDRALDYATKAVRLIESRRSNIGEVRGMSALDVQKFYDGEVAELTDTLAHCYAAKGNFAEAVRYQARATELDPNSQQIRHALEQFRKALKESGK